MKKLLALIMILAVSCAPTKPLQKSEPEIVRDTMTGVVKIEVSISEQITDTDGGVQEDISEGWHGSGFVVKSDTVFNTSIIATAAHVASTPAISSIERDGDLTLTVKDVQMSITTFDGKKCSAKAIEIDKEHDVALLEVDCAAGVPLDLGNVIEVGANVMIVSAPKGFHPDSIFSVSDGRYLGETAGELIVSAPVTPGSSGGPILVNGVVIAVVVRGIRGYEHITIGAKIEHVKVLLDKIQRA